MMHSKKSLFFIVGTITTALLVLLGRYLLSLSYSSEVVMAIVIASGYLVGAFSSLLVHYQNLRSERLHSNDFHIDVKPKGKFSKW